MKDYTVNFKQYNMLCDKCLINVVKSLSTLNGIEDLEISLESKKINIALVHKLNYRKGANYVDKILIK